MRFVGLITGFLLLCICAYGFYNHAEIIINWIDTLGIVAPLFFLLLYCVGAAAFLPTMVLTLAGGALFGPVFGVFYNLIGACLGASCAFCISRFLLSDVLAKKQSKRINKLIQGVEDRGWQFVAILRLLPIIPSSIVNYGLGLTKIKFKSYLITTFIFLIPAEIFYTYCGHVGLDVFLNSTESIKNFNYLFLVIVFIAIAGKLLSEVVEQIISQKIDKSR